MAKRIVDIHGSLLCGRYLSHYYEALNNARKMINKLDKEGVDRSDIVVAVNNLVQEINSHIVFLPKRKVQNDL